MSDWKDNMVWSHTMDAPEDMGSSQCKAHLVFSPREKPITPEELKIIAQKYPEKRIFVVPDDGEYERF